MLSYTLESKREGSHELQIVVAIVYPFSEILA